MPVHPDIPPGALPSGRHWKARPAEPRLVDRQGCLGAFLLAGGRLVRGLAPERTFAALTFRVADVESAPDRGSMSPVWLGPGRLAGWRPLALP